MVITQMKLFSFFLFSFYLEIDSRMSDNGSSVEAKPRLPYVKRTRIQYTLQQVRSNIGNDMIEPLLFLVTNSWRSISK